MGDVGVHINTVRSASDLAATVQLFEEYASSLGVDLCFQDFASELAAMPGKYAPPAGELLLARGADGEPIGCVALRPMADDGRCEMKRLYVSPKARGLGLGRALVDAILHEAIRIGYREMRLDTLPSMTQAISLYKQVGFVPIERYYDTPLAETIFLGCSLAQTSAS